MPKRNAEAIRPGSVFHAWETTWRVLENDTLHRRLILLAIDDPTPVRRKRIQYNPGQEIFLRWEPFNQA